MKPWQRVGLVVAILLVAGGGVATLVLRDPMPSAADVALALDAAATDGSHLGRVPLPDTGAPAAGDLGQGTLRPEDLIPAGRSGPRMIDWDDLVPPEGGGTPISFAQGTAERAGMPDREAFGDASDADIEDFVRDIDDMRSLQPPGAEIRTDLDGIEVRIAGYATPIGFDDTSVTEFLLVPWLGACIHTPPPPANQIVYATEAEGLDAAEMWEPIWLTGTLRAVPSATVLADVGYRIEGARVEAYR